jgi:hypothetical protein
MEWNPICRDKLEIDHQEHQEGVHIDSQMKICITYGRECWGRAREGIRDVLCWRSSSATTSGVDEQVVSKE